MTSLDSSDLSHTPVQVGTDGLLASLPVLLGFHPRDSLVLVATGGPGGRRVGLTLRVDLPPPDDPELLVALAASAAETLRRDDPVGVLVVVVGGIGPDHGFAHRDGGVDAGMASGAGWSSGAGQDSGRDAPRADVAEAAVAALRERGMAAPTVAWVAATEEGAPWCCYAMQGCGCRGALPDPASTVLAATAAVRGTVVYGSREELARQVGPAPDNPTQDRAAARDWPADPRAALAAALRAAEAGRLVVDAVLVRVLSAGLRTTAFRDEALLACTGPRTAAAEQLWAALARTCPGPAAADPAALLAVCALVRGDGALAGVALERALAARPAHGLSHSLRQAQAAGWGPAEFRTWLEGER
jgi:hypothetical protein